MLIALKLHVEHVLESVLLTFFTQRVSVGAAAVCCHPSLLQQCLYLLAQAVLLSTAKKKKKKKLYGITQQPAL